MSVEGRLHSLVAQARQQHGDAFLRVPSQLVPRLVGQAPDLHAEIKAVAAALEGDVASRIAVAADQSGETARIAAEIAARERLSIGPVQSALAVATRLGPLAAGASPPAAGGWAGDSVAVGGGAGAYVPPQPPYQPPPGHGYIPPEPAAPAAAEPIWKNKWALGAAGAAALFFFYQSQQTAPGTQPVGGNESAPLPPPQPQPQPQPLPPPPQPQPQPQPQPPGADGLPTLQPANGNVPTIAAQPAANGSLAIAFQVQTRGGPMPGFVMLPPGGWDGGPGTFAFVKPGNTNASQPDTMGQALFQRISGQSRPVRAAQPQWQQDNAGLGSICIAFMGRSGGGPQGNGDVALDGADMCVMDGACSQAAGCGRIRYQAGPGAGGGRPAPGSGPGSR